MYKINNFEFITTTLKKRVYIMLTYIRINKYYMWIKLGTIMLTLA